ncbi:hypothetical protein CBR_g22008 [Chara braunii]|uniref:Uncharacterized protein n=1 Tax=Chara braunii TaxID=69332 RepID=A0A388L1S1_CHABU|nr:hypothetical protein CBR_g22008 [Chara braunii]|eukprot:GBG76260.1 hypothetical protein CBR_g22008 [Chara braunii]
MEEVEAKKKGSSGEVSKSNWEKVESPSKNGDNAKGGECDSKKRNQGTMAGGGTKPPQQETGRPRVEPAVAPLDTGLIRMDIDSLRKAQDVQAAMFREMLNCLQAIHEQGASCSYAPPPPPPPPAHTFIPPIHPNPLIAVPPHNHPPPIPHPPDPPAPPQPPPPPPPTPTPATPSSPPPAPPPPPSDINRRGGATAPGLSRTRSGQEQMPSGGGFSSRLAGMFASVANTRRRSGIFSNEGAEPQELGFDRINKGKKAAVAEPGKKGRSKYVEELTEVLFNKSKHELEELCKKEKIKYVNNKITSAALTRLRGIDAYGEEDEDEESEEDVQEENPS